MTYNVCPPVPKIPKKRIFENNMSTIMLVRFVGFDSVCFPNQNSI